MSNYVIIVMNKGYKSKTSLTIETFVGYGETIINASLIRRLWLRESPS